MTLNGLALMAVAGALGAAGIATGALHIVIGAMVVAPGFEPITRFGLGLAASGGAWRRGLAHTLQGYLALIAGAFLTTLALIAMGKQPLGFDFGCCRVGSGVRLETRADSQATDAAVTR